MFNIYLRVAFISRYTSEPKIQVVDSVVVVFAVEHPKQHTLFKIRFQKRLRNIIHIDLFKLQQVLSDIF